MQTQKSKYAYSATILVSSFFFSLKSNFFAIFKSSRNVSSGTDLLELYVYLANTYMKPLINPLYIALRYGHKYFKIFALFALQNFQGMFNHFSTLCIKVLISYVKMDVQGFYSMPVLELNL